MFRNSIEISREICQGLKTRINRYHRGKERHVTQGSRLTRPTTWLGWRAKQTLIDKVYSELNLFTSARKVVGKKGAAGVDRQSTEDFSEKEIAEIRRLHEQLQTRTYRPLAVRRVQISKPGSPQKRPLGIPTVRDRVVQTALVNVIAPIFDNDFHERSFGFRRGRSCHDALRVVEGLLESGHVFVVDADLQSYFDTIPKDRLMTLVRSKISDRGVLELIEGFLNQSILEDLREWTPESGVPQGAVLSPLLSNLYLNEQHIQFIGSKTMMDINRSMLSVIDMPWNWPAEINYLEAKAFCNWKSEAAGQSIRMPTEAEWYQLRNELETDQPYWDRAPGNINLEYEMSCCLVDRHEFQDGFYDIIGNVWQWTETPVDGYDGYEVHGAYDDFSTPTFDGKHNLFKGGSWISTGNEATKDARFAFRRHFFQSAGLRYVEAEPLPEIELNVYETDQMARWFGWG